MVHCPAPASPFFQSLYPVSLPLQRIPPFISTLPFLFCKDPPNSPQKTIKFYELFITSSLTTTSKTFKYALHKHLPLRGGPLLRNPNPANFEFPPVRPAGSH